MPIYKSQPITLLDVTDDYTKDGGPGVVWTFRFYHNPLHA